MTHIHAQCDEQLKFKGQSVQKIEWTTNGSTDRQTDATYCFAFSANAVGENNKNYTIVQCQSRYQCRSVLINRRPDLVGQIVSSFQNRIFYVQMLGPVRQ